MANLYIHPEYLYQRSDWQKWNDLYHARPDVVNSRTYLYPHFIESLTAEPYTKQQIDGSAKLRASREQRTKYVNHPEMITSIWTSVLFKEKPEADDATIAMLGDEEQNIDGRGTCLNTFIKNYLFRNLAIFGKPILLCNSTSDKPISKGQEKAIGARAFFTCIHPLNFVDWSYNTQDAKDFYKLNFARYEYQVVAPRATPEELPVIITYSDAYILQGGKVTVNRYKRKLDSKGNAQQKNPDATKSASDLASGENWELTDTIETTLDRIPLSIIEDESWIRDVAEETLRFHNLRSNADNILLNQGYQRIWFTGVDPGNPEAVKSMSESVINFIKNKDAQILQVSPTELGAYERAMTESVNSIFKLGLNQITTLASDSKLIQSAESKSLDKDNLNDLIYSTMEDLETLVNDGLKNYAYIKGDPNFDGKIEFNKELTEQDEQKFITVWSALRDLYTKYPDIQTEVAKKGIGELGLSEESQKIALDAIDAGAVEPVQTNTNDPVHGFLNGNNSQSNPQQNG